jgi:hypothetical protein
MPEDEDEIELEDSIRGSQKSHRRPDAAAAIADGIAREREFKVGAGEKTELATTSTGPGKGSRRSLEDSLPLSPARAAKLGLTSILPPMRAKSDERFRRFLLEITDPDLRHQFPTWTALATHFEVSVQTIKTWLLSEEASQALAIGISHEARLMMPSVLRSVRLRAEVTGDPHAAEFIRKIAKLGTAETDASRSFESTLRAIAASRASAEPKLVEAKVVTIEP